MSAVRAMDALNLPYGVLLHRNTRPEAVSANMPLYLSDGRLVVALEPIPPGAVGKVAARGCFRLPNAANEQLSTGDTATWDPARRCLTSRSVGTGRGFAAVRRTARRGVAAVRVRLCNYVHPDELVAE